MEKTMRANNFDQLYSSILWNLYTTPDYIVDGGTQNDSQRQCGYKELNGFQMKLTNIDDNIITHNKARGFKLDYAKDFFKYVMDGNPEQVAKNPKAVEYLTEFAGRNTQYGPRIHAQLGNMLEELIHDGGSRRGSIMILDSNDQGVFYGKRFGDTSIEYPCTNSLTFSIRDSKLHLVSNMRSQSAAMVMPYDIYNWTNLMVYVCELLLPRYPDLECGTLTHQVASLHYYLDEEELVKNILTEYGLMV